MVWIILLGVATGMRTMTPIAVLCWFMWFAALPVTQFNFWTANVFSAGIFTLLAAGEYYADTLPRTPSRKSPGPFAARLVFAALVGALVSSSFLNPLVGGILFGLVGALIGTFGGYRLRLYLAGRLNNDLPVAVCESAFALGISVLAMHQLCGEFVDQQHEALLRLLVWH
jgi:uncharacterized membrane protein